MTSLLLDPTAALAHQRIRDLADQARRHQLAGATRAESPKRPAWLSAAWARLSHRTPRTHAVANGAVCCA